MANENLRDVVKARYGEAAKRVVKNSGGKGIGQSYSLPAGQRFAGLLVAATTTSFCCASRAAAITAGMSDAVSIEPPATGAACAGPFRWSESWWERPVERDYYQLASVSDGLLLVFHDLRDGQWYMQGIFD